MSYRKFSTENADYYLVYVMHSFKTDEDILRRPKIESLDAIVLESAELFGSTDEDTWRVVYNTQYDEIRGQVRQAKKEIPVYLVDVNMDAGGTLFSLGGEGLKAATGCMLCKRGISDLNKKTGRRDFIKGTIKTLLGISIWGTYVGQTLNSIPSGEAAPILPEINSTLSYLPPTPILGLRNAMTARKIEEFVAPKLRKEKNKKPLIAIVYGGLHSGIETDLKYKPVRDKVLGFYEAINYLGMEKEGLNIVWEINLKNRHRIKHMAELFW